MKIIPKYKPKLFIFSSRQSDFFLGFVQAIKPIERVRVIKYLGLIYRAMVSYIYNGKHRQQ